MKLMIASAFTALFLLSSCAKYDRDLTPLTDPGQLEVSKELLEPCPDPTQVPERATYAQGIRLWQEDRNRLRGCKRKHEGLAQTAVELE